MLETIFEWITNACANLLDGLVNMFLGMLEFDLSLVVNEFPILIKAYDIFQAVGVGLVIAIAAINLTKFFTGQTSDAKETPIAILFRSLLAAALIYMGGHAVMWVVDIAKLPYDAMLNLDAVSGWGVDGGLNVEELAICVPAVIASVGVGPGAALLASATTLLAMIMVVLIAFNVIRLIVEVCQRFLMVAVLTYSAPLVFSTAASKDTTHILQKWISMFFGQCLLMTLSVWTLKAIVSGFAYDSAADTNYFFKFLMTLAMCKIAQRLDTYIQQLGINAATTGGNLLAEAIGAVSMLGMGTGAGRRGNGATVLGGGMKKYMGQGLVGAIPGAFAAGKKAYETGSSIKEAVKAAASNYAKNANPFQAPQWVKDTRANRKTYMDEQAQKAKEEHAKWTDKYTDGSGATAAPTMDPEAVGAASVNQPIDPMSDAEGYYPVLNGTGTAGLDEDGNLGFSDDFYASGLGLETATDEDGNEMTYIGGDGDLVSDHIAGNYSSSNEIGEEYQDILKNTVDNSSPAVAQAALMGSEFTLSAGDELSNGTYKNDAVGSPLMEKAFGNATKNENGVQTRVGGFTGVTAHTAPDRIDANGNKVYNGRFADGDYITANGEKKHLTVADQKGYEGLSAEQKAQFKPFTSETGDTYYARTSSRDGIARPAERVQNTGSSSSSYNTRVEGGYPDYKGGTAKQSVGAVTGSPNLTTATIPDGEAGAGKKFVTGDPMALSNYLATSYTSAGAHGQDYQDSLIETVNRNPAAVAENAVMHPYSNLEPGKEIGNGVYQNDRVGSAMLEKAFGDATVDENGTQLRAGGFTNVQAVTAPPSAKTGNTIPGGKFVNADFMTDDGRKMHMTMTNATGYAGMSEYQKSQYKPFASESGEQYYSKITPEKGASPSYTVPKTADTNEVTSHNMGGAPVMRTGAMNPSPEKMGSATKGSGINENVGGGLGAKPVNTPTDSRFVDSGSGITKREAQSMPENIGSHMSDKPVVNAGTPEAPADTTAFAFVGRTGTATTNNNGNVEFDEAFTDAGLELKSGAAGSENAGSYISGSNSTVGEHLAENFNKAEAVDGYQSVLINTAQAAPVAAEKALMNSPNNLSGNDAVGSAYMENAFAQATIGENGEQLRQGGFTNVSAYNAPSRVAEDGTESPGGRFVSGDFSTAEGNRTMTVTDQAGYDSLTEKQKSDYTPFNGASGEQYYKKISPTDEASKIAHIGAGQQGRQQKAATGLQTDTPGAPADKAFGSNGANIGNEYKPTGTPAGLGAQKTQEGMPVNNANANAPNADNNTPMPANVGNAAGAPVKIGATPIAMEQPAAQAMGTGVDAINNSHTPTSIPTPEANIQKPLESNGVPSGHGASTVAGQPAAPGENSRTEKVSSGPEGTGAKSVEGYQPVQKIGSVGAGKDLSHDGSATLGDRDGTDIDAGTHGRTGTDTTEAAGHEGSREGTLHTTETPFTAHDSSRKPDSSVETEGKTVETRQPAQKIGSVGEGESLSRHEGGSTLGTREGLDLDSDSDGHKGVSHEHHDDGGHYSSESESHEGRGTLNTERDSKYPERENPYDAAPQSAPTYPAAPAAPSVGATTPMPTTSTATFTPTQVPVQTPVQPITPAQPVNPPQEAQVVQTAGAPVATKEMTSPRAAAVSAASNAGDASVRPVAGTKTPETIAPERVKVEQVERRVQEEKYTPERKDTDTSRRESSSYSSPAPAAPVDNRRSSGNPSKPPEEKSFIEQGSRYGDNHSDEHQNFHVLDASNMRGNPGKQGNKKNRNKKNNKNKR